MKSVIAVFLELQKIHASLLIPSFDDNSPSFQQVFLSATQNILKYTQAY